MIETALKKNFVTIEVDQQTKIVCITWEGGCTSKEYRESMEKGFELAKEYKLNGWLSDTTHGSAISPEDYKWVTTDLIPRALGIVNKVAIKISEDIFRQMMTDEIASDVSKQTQDMKLKYFNNREEAIAWLCS